MWKFSPTCNCAGSHNTTRARRDAAASASWKETPCGKASSTRKTADTVCPNYKCNVNIHLV